MQNTKFITGLKALGAIMIVVSHLKMRLSGYSDFGWKILLFSDYFIMLFICISAFTIAMSLDKKKDFHFFSYLKRRYLRLAPSYYIAILAGLVVRTAISGSQYFFATIPNLLYIFLFLNLDPIHIPSQAAVLSVEWMLPILFWFYVLIPIFLYLLRKVPSIFFLLFAGSIYLHFNPTAIMTYTGFGGFKWSFQFYILPYAYTILMYFLFTRVNKLQIKNSASVVISGVGALLCFSFLFYYISSNSERIYAFFLIALTFYLMWIKGSVMNLFRRKSTVLSVIVDNADILVLSVILIKYMINVYFVQHPHLILTIWFIALLIACSYRPVFSRVLFENRYIQFLGLISFGIYLLHPLVILFAEIIISMDYPILRLVFIFPVTIALAYTLYRFIELPLRKLS